MKEEITIDHITLKFTSLDKILFPKSKITKNELIEYYLKIAPVFLRYIHNRPLTLQRFPQGIEHPGFIQKHASSFPNWIHSIDLPTNNEPVRYATANKTADIAYFANLNTITFHVTTSTVPRINYPDALIFDLDPSDNDFDNVIKVALRIKDTCEELGIRSWLKTTGSRGLHIYIPLNGKILFDTIHSFSKKLATYLADKYPKEITIAQQKAKRNKKVLIDYVRNSYGQTIVAPYSIRAREFAPIAVPIEWEELGTTVTHSTQFNIHNIEDRIKQKGYPWLNKKINNSNLSKIIKEFMAKDL